MKLLLIIFIFTNVSCKIPEFLHNYIKSSKRLEKYSITILQEYEKNSTGRFLEEKLYLRPDYVDLKNNKLVNKDIKVAICEKDLEEINNKKSYSISVLEILRDILEFRIKYNLIDLKNEEYDFIDSESYFTNNSFDLILCTTNLNLNYFQVLYPTIKSSYVIIYKPSNISINQDIFILTFAGTLWFCFVFIILLLAICLNLSTKKYSTIYGHPSWGTVDITFWGIAAACQQGLSTTPTGFASRLIFLLGYSTAYLLYTGFAAGITSLLAVQNENFILKITDIENMHLDIATFGNIESLPSQYKYLKNGQSFKTLHSFLYGVYSRKIVGVTEKTILQQYFTSEEKMFDYCDFITSELKHSEYPTSFLMPKKSPYEKIFNYWLLRLDQTGILNLTSEHSKPILPTCQSPPGYSSATLDHVGSAIMLLVTGFVTSLVFLLMECLWNGYKHRTSLTRHY